GHTVQSLLDVSYQTSYSFIYQSWLFLRAFTAPIFIFSSGIVFSYLLFQKPLSFSNNPRILKGIKRGTSLILIGYLLRYPTIKIFNLGNVSSSQWITFFTIDALHLIGIGILSILLFAFISSRLKINSAITFSILTLSVFVISPVVNSIVWNSSGNIFLTSYITFQFGSIFPLFPYLQFIFLGAIWGILIAEKPRLLSNNGNIYIILFFSLFIIAFAYALKTNYSDSLLRVGVIFVLLSLFEYISRSIKRIPKIIESLARNSLWIYIIHLVILYGSPTSIGLYQIIGKTLSAETTIFIALLMLILMTIISLGIDKFRVTKFNIFRQI
ncbi:MAG: heparan-alpha-glucosaminide N-acetyltransferase domain-containing protein, partial [Melioribacteraceae bacterium]|nr:heparan-alpha-glucosaminide N-acetyltransferase domain-containing protein [Melioribacteraceae bacterium]